LLADAVRLGADTILTSGAVQSNHARQTAAACAMLGLRCVLFLQRRVPGRGPNYERSGNILLDQIAGAEVHVLPGEADAGAAVEEHASTLRGEGRKPYVIPGGGSNAIGALGYVECARELFAQAAEIEMEIDAIVHASASRGTQAGLAVGLAELKVPIRLLGVSVSSSAATARTTIERIAAATCAGLGAPNAFRGDRGRRPLRRRRVRGPDAQRDVGDRAPRPGSRGCCSTQSTPGRRWRVS
jgi:L-cysteate sulfo-lyase